MSSASAPIRGILFMIATTLIFAAQDGLSKQLAAAHSPIFITMLRYWFFGAVVVVILSRRGFRAGLRSGQPTLQVLRGVLLALEICVAIAAFHLHGLLETHAIFAFGPLMVVALSGPLLGERVGWRRWAAVGVGMIGMLMILRPGTQTVSMSMGIAVLGMLMFAAYGLMTRRAARTDSAMTSFYYTGLFGAITMTIIGPFFMTPMGLQDAALMALLCVTGMTGHYLLIKAFEAAEAAVIQPFAYLQTVFASAIGVAIFSEPLSPWTVAGGAVVMGAGLFAFWREQVRAREAAESGRRARKKGR